MSRHPRQPDDTDNEGFFARWSKRKNQAQPNEPAAEEQRTKPDADSVKAEEPLKSDEDMPPLETIDGSSDVSEFFSPGVSEGLRRAALRKLFHSPEFNIVDGLDDYDDNFTTFKALGDIVTADMRHQMELESERQEIRRAEKQNDSPASRTEEETLNSSQPEEERAGGDSDELTEKESDQEQSIANDAGSRSTADDIDEDTVS